MIQNLIELIKSLTFSHLRETFNNNIYIYIYIYIYILMMLFSTGTGLERVEVAGLDPDC